MAPNLSVPALRLTQAKHPGAVIAAALDESSGALGARAVGVYRWSEGKVDLDTKGGSDRAVAQYLSYGIAADPLLTAMRQTALPVHERQIFPEVAAWKAQPLYQHVVAPHDLEHYLTAPIFGSSGIVGALIAARRADEPTFSSIELAAAATLAACIAVGLIYSSHRETSQETGVARLTERERSIAVLVAKGLCNHEIAHQLLVSPDAIKKHLKQIFAKLGVSRRAELAWLATVAGLTS